MVTKILKDEVVTTTTIVIGVEKCGVVKTAIKVSIA